MTDLATSSSRLASIISHSLPASLDPVQAERRLNDAGSDPRLALQALSPDQRRYLEERWGSARLREFFSLTRENDAELLGEALFSMARRFEGEDRMESAALVYSEVDRLASPVSERARTRLQVMAGAGSFGDQAEFALRNLTRSLLDPAALAAMGAAGSVYRIGRLAVLGRVLSNPTAGLFTRGLGARALASGLAFAAEGAVFPAAHDLFAGNFSNTLSAGGGSFATRVLSSYCVLGGLRLSGFAGRGLTRGLNISPGLTAMAFGQVTMFGGILVGHGMERALNLRPERPWSATMAESLATLVHFNMAGSLLRRVGGEGFESWQRRLDWQSQSLSYDFLPLRSRIRFGATTLGPAEALAGGPLLMASQENGEKGGGLPPRALSTAEGEARYRRMAESAWGVFITLNQEGKVVDVNPAVERVFGYKPTEILGQSLGLLMTPELAVLHEAGLRRFVETGTPSGRVNLQGQRLPARHKNGQQVDVHIVFDTFQREGSRYFTGMITEIGRTGEESESTSAAPITGPSGQRVLEYGSLLAVTTTLLSERPPLLMALALGDVRVRVTRNIGDGLDEGFMENLVKVLNFHSRRLNLFENATPKLTIEIFEDGSLRQSALVSKNNGGFVWEMAGAGRATSLGRTTASYPLPDLGAATQQVGGGAETPFGKATAMLQVRRTTGRTTARLPRVPAAPEGPLAAIDRFAVELEGAFTKLSEAFPQGEYRVPLRLSYGVEFFIQHEVAIREHLRLCSSSMPLGFRVVFPIAGGGSAVFVKAIGGFRRE